MRGCSTASLNASSADILSAYSGNSVNKNHLTLPPFRPMPMVESDVSLMGLCILVPVLLTCIEPGGCEFGTGCVRTIGDEIATELNTKFLRVKETQSLKNRDWVRPALQGSLDEPDDACVPSSHPLLAGKQRVGRTTTKSN